MNTQKTLGLLTVAMDFVGERSCPPSGRMGHLKADLWSVPGYDNFEPDTPGINAESEVVLFAFAVAMLLKPKLIVETGSYCGLTARALGYAAISNGNGCEVYTCDVDPKAIFATQQICPGSVTVVSAPASQLHDKISQCDLLFSDSSYESRIEEIRWLKPGAIGILHDTGMEDHLDREIRSLYPGSVFIPTPRGLTMFQKE
ncbi:MAG TPA: class I SAM-dependent methyltransferase [Candidatus Sulfotelmatobacter sp.]|nr:class I SAM-dependent methyltransferase [Candidatus Sulfotelmatobacter sp.]